MKGKVRVAMRAAAIVDGFDDIADASEVLQILEVTLVMVLCIAARDKSDALGTLDVIYEFVRGDLLEKYDNHTDVLLTRGIKSPPDGPHH